MTEVVTKTCYYTGNLSVEWSQHDDSWVLTANYDDGDVDSLRLDDDMLEAIKEMAKVM